MPDRFQEETPEEAAMLSKKEGEKVPLGIFYNVEKPTFEEQLISSH